MKKLIFSIAVLVFLVIWTLVLRANWSLDHIWHTSFPSPSGKFIAIEYLGGEGNNPPYGKQVIIKESRNPLGQYFAEPIPSGYWKELSVQWQSDQKVTVSCSEAGNIAIKKTSYKSIEIIFNFSPVS